jgi:hypothetical protein
MSTAVGLGVDHLRRIGVLMSLAADDLDLGRRSRSAAWAASGWITQRGQWVMIGNTISCERIRASSSSTVRGEFPCPARSCHISRLFHSADAEPGRASIRPRSGGFQCTVSGSVMRNFPAASSAYARPCHWPIVIRLKDPLLRPLLQMQSNSKAAKRALEPVRRPSESYGEPLRFEMMPLNSSLQACSNASGPVLLDVLVQLEGASVTRSLRNFANIIRKCRCRKFPILPIRVI